MKALSMRFSGKNLALVRLALDLASDELYNMIATCPDVNEYAEDIEGCEEKIKQLTKLINKIDNKGLT